MYMHTYAYIHVHVHANAYEMCMSSVCLCRMPMHWSIGAGHRVSRPRSTESVGDSVGEGAGGGGAEKNVWGSLYL